jgi:alpha-ketoglutarate-dependent taurine dioxygenase
MSSIDGIPTITPAAGPTSQVFLRKRIANELQELRRLMAASGAVRFRGYDVPDLADCQSLANLLAPEEHSLQGGDSPRSVRRGRVFSANESDPTKGVYLHGERSYSNHRPTVILFFCRQAPKAGGRCLFADGREIWSSLSPETAWTLANRLIRYTRNLPCNATPSRRSWQQTFGATVRSEVDRYAAAIGATSSWQDDGSLVFSEDVLGVRVHRTSGERALMCPAPHWHVRRLPEDVRRDVLASRGPQGFHTACKFTEGGDIPESVLDEILAATNGHTRSFAWRSGDVLAVDNEVALHGRTPFAGSRELLVALGSDRTF